MLQIHDGQCLSNHKTTQPTSPGSLTDSSVLFLLRRPFHTVLPVCLVKQLKCLCKTFTKFAAKFQAYELFFKLFVTLLLIQRTVCACAQFSRCSLKTNAHSETGQTAVYCQNLMLSTLSTRSVLSVFVAMLFFLSTPRTP